MQNTIENMIYDFIVDNELATENEIQLVTNINGWNEDALTDIVWARTEYHDPKQCVECEPDNFYMREELREYYGLNDEEEEEDE